MLRFMLDTNIVIEVLRYKPAALRSRFVAHGSEMTISSITVAELYHGVEKSTARTRNLQATEDFLAIADVVDFDSRGAAHAGQIRAELATRGEPIGPYDVLIAGHARSRGLVLVTNNRREFDRVPGLQVEDWSAD